MFDSTRSTLGEFGNRIVYDTTNIPKMHDSDLEIWKSVSSIGIQESPRFYKYH